MIMCLKRRLPHCLVSDGDGQRSIHGGVSSSQSTGTENGDGSIATTFRRIDQTRRRSGSQRRTGESPTNGTTVESKTMLLIDDCGRSLRSFQQYEEAIRATQRGLPYDYNELPEMPGFAPIPVHNAQPAAAASSHAPAQARPSQPRPAAAPVPTTTGNSGLGTRSRCRSTDEKKSVVRFSGEEKPAGSNPSTETGEILQTRCSSETER